MPSDRATRERPPQGGPEIVDGRTPVAWVNDRVWQYHILDATATGLTARDVTSVHSGDPNKDGNRDLLLFTTDGIRLLVSRGGFRFEERPGFADRCGRLGERAASLPTWEAIR